MIEPKPIAEDEVNLQQYVDVLRRRRWTILYTAVAILVLGCVATALMTPIYEAEAKLLVRASSPEINTMDTENPLVDLLAMTQPETVETQMEVLQSGPFLDEVFKASRAPTDEREPQVRVSKVKDTNVIELTVTAPDRKLTARVANAMLEHYLERTRALSLQEVVAAREFVQKRADAAQGNLQRAEDALLKFRRDNRVAELTAEQQNRTEEFVNLETKSREAHNDIIRVQAQMRDVRAQLAHQSEERVLATGQKNPAVEALQAKIAEATVERDTLRQSYRPESPKLKALDAQLASLQARLSAEPQELRVPLHVPNERYDKLVDRLDTYQTELEGLQAQSAQLEAQLVQKRARMNQLGPWEVRLAQLQREREMAEKSYLNLAARVEDLQIRENARRSTARVLERAVTPAAPVRPRKVANIALSLFLGLLLGSCLAFLLESLDDRITTPEEVDRLLGLPVLGYIPAIAGECRLIHSLPSHSPIAESYRTLRSGISFSSVDAPLATLAISSARPGEGKSTTAVNLALAMAMDGRSVILVDTDLRRPSIHRVLGLRPAPGVTDVLTGQCSLEDAFQSIRGHEMLVLTSGPIPPNPAEMLNTAAMENLIHQLREKADVVIFDTPPCLGITDAQVLGAKLDGLVLVAEMGEARKAEVRRARELLDQAHIRLLGVVFNKISEQNAGYSYRYAYYRSPYATEGHLNGGSNGHHEAVVLPTVAGRRGGESGSEIE
jgi:polysaccharide biosynthesis transport protein